MSATLNESLDSLFSSRYPDASAPGASILIAAGDKVLYERQFGVADMGTLRPVAAETAFNIASVSKQFTVVGALALADEGLLDIDTPLSRFFPQWSSPIWKKVTLRHLMSQSSGIPDLRPRNHPRDVIFADDSTAIRYFDTLDTLRFEPGSAYDYVNPTFILIARVIEQITGLSFIEFQQRRVFDEIGMGSTCYFDPAGMPGYAAHAYVPDRFGRWVVYEYGQETFFATRPDGGIYSTARDLLKWERALRDNLIISDHALRQAYSLQTRVSGSEWCDYQNRPDTYYGLGFFVDTTPGMPRKVYHTGDNGGFQAYLAKYPDRNVVIIVLENRNDKDRWTMAREIDRLLTNYGLL